MTDSLAAPLLRSASGAMPSDSAHSKMGSGFKTMPSPPPNGRSSTVRCLSRVNARRSRTLISMSSASRARRTMPYSSGPRKKSGNIVRISNFIPVHSPPCIVHSGLKQNLFPFAIVALAVLLAFLFFAERRVQFKQAGGEFHLQPLGLRVKTLQPLGGERDQQLAATRFHHQERRFTCSALHG